MKPFAERNPFVIGVAGMALTAGVAVIALQYDKLPFVSSADEHSAYFAEAGGLRAGAPVQVAGFRVGQVSAIELDGTQVRVDFDVSDDVRLGDLTEAHIRTKSLLGSKVLEVTPRGEGDLNSAIPIERTRSPYQLPDALGDLSATISGLNTDTVSDALSTLAQTFQDTPPELKAAVEGVGRFSQTLGERDTQLRNLLSNASKATEVLSDRADEVAELVANSNALLRELRNQSAALEQISRNLSVFAQQLSAFIETNRAQMRPALDKLNGVLTIVDNRKDRVMLAIKYLNQYTMSLGDAVGSGPFFKAYLANLPGQLVQPFIDSAFSDLGLDPNVLAPSQLSDPQTGQPATPALPVPFPRTGQGGPPHVTLPDAITGNPADPRYPYREPEQAPAPGGPAPGPPALWPEGQQPSKLPTPPPVSDPVTAPAGGGQ
ncbi:MCE family protein [Mycolicibacterium parafortuitum]|uniref:Mce-family protein Mce3C [Mycobacterium tuberculosis H37Rv] n=1 Tax=Mycolicibacterium parafortuitum TaxID=39692 RepID=A0A375YB27_MYCPF|nr:MCE family protein [Mycolicibacterium parafortuitum]ORB31748.1 mammalian cell entry protein [Mycolicibacterium parafortuitum]SRX78310.1 Mce-family protein Mce3C [Mycobacterium tuberculosis H37Rv] [Mycolicibacterium parafortuitum]